MSDKTTPVDLALAESTTMRLATKFGGPDAELTIRCSAFEFFDFIALKARNTSNFDVSACAKESVKFSVHKWVNENLDVLSPAAFHSYLDLTMIESAAAEGVTVRDLIKRNLRAAEERRLQWASAGAGEQGITIEEFERRQAQYADEVRQLLQIRSTLNIGTR